MSQEGQAGKGQPGRQWLEGRGVGRARGSLRASTPSSRARTSHHLGAALSPLPLASVPSSYISHRLRVPAGREQQSLGSYILSQMTQEEKEAAQVISRNAGISLKTKMGT